MCRLLGYLGKPIQLEHLIYKPDHSLIVQSYQPKEMTSGLLNADGFGVGWYHAHHQVEPYTYKNTLPIWNDINLPSLSRYVESGCILASVRSATPGLPVDLSNCQPFQSGSILGIHNGFVSNFRQTLYRPLRNRLSDKTYKTIIGNTDSEHIFALFLNELEKLPNSSLTTALHNTIDTLCELAHNQSVDFSANIIISNGNQLVASRFANRDPVPTLYWLQTSSFFSEALLVASEPIFEGDWQPLPSHSILTVSHDLKPQIQPI
ncbi:MAG TPA: ergothioneine biosynthesis protein EgtC [Leptolyngbyaceae cyanobacterium M33_DOE_097]|uniref:Ergothioneine biosynthesis protein EgtC n=1 Tax=Oscillatoriales cyanobacterium SpSt-418 TaxID=2282169 RepID=A0A7C3PHR1_9CYAN|nr:ergothioneine biosynthesis protein EgtC [Leptolyngbyaceae cyanobacterium M33_DOE_097]